VVKNKRFLSWMHKVLFFTKSFWGQMVPTPLDTIKKCHESRLIIGQWELLPQGFTRFQWGASKGNDGDDRL
jgi:hypothetical protein